MFMAHPEAFYHVFGRAPSHPAASIRCSGVVAHSDCVMNAFSCNQSAAARAGKQGGRANGVIGCLA
jgi:hypothetical protein